MSPITKRSHFEDQPAGPRVPPSVPPTLPPRRGRLAGPGRGVATDLLETNGVGHRQQTRDLVAAIRKLLTILNAIIRDQCPWQTA